MASILRVGKFMKPDGTVVSFIHTYVAVCARARSHTLVGRELACQCGLAFDAASGIGHGMFAAVITDDDTMLCRAVMCFVLCCAVCVIFTGR